MITMDIDLTKGQDIGSMHGHEPCGSRSPLGGFKPVAIIEIDEDQATLIASSIGKPAIALKRDAKTGYVVAANDAQAVVIYFYDSGFFLTTLSR